jgi:uncharacterized protein YdiU (UPF0061 family)
MTSRPLIDFDNSYARLPERFYARLSPTPVPRPSLIQLNEGLAIDLGLDPERLRSREGVEVLAGNRVPDGAEPIAMAYAGFQFGGWVPQLGDGRAILLGETIDRAGVRRDIQLKGSGRTPFSRGGDGRAGVGPVLREYVVSEAMARLGVPTTRSLAAVATGEQIARETLLPGAVLTRVARSHIRIGTFQYFAARHDGEALRLLADHVIARHYPHAAQAERPYLELLAAVIERQADLVARWQAIGFIHGVMNTDNTSITGETIDYGPCAFMDTFHPATVYSSIDHGGRYAYGNQPPILQWNLAGLAQVLLPLIDENEDTAVTLARQKIDEFAARYAQFYAAVMRRKLGLGDDRDGDATLIGGLLAIMAEQRADFTLTFRRLSDVDTADPATLARVGELFADRRAFDDWAGRWLERLAAEPRAAAERQAEMRAVNPLYIPRNHLVEEALAAAVEHADYTPLRRLLAVLRSPFEEQPSAERYAMPPRPEEVVQQTFCGT